MQRKSNHHKWECQKNFNDYLTLTIKAKLLIQFTSQSWSDVVGCALVEVLVVEVLVVEVVLIPIGVVGAVAGFIGREGHLLCASVHLCLCASVPLCIWSWPLCPLVPTGSGMVFPPMLASLQHIAGALTC